MPKREKANFSHVWWPFIYCLSLGLGKCSPQQLWGKSNLCTANAVRYLCKKANFITVLDSLFRILALPKDLHCNNANSTNPWLNGNLEAPREQWNGIHKSWGYVQVWPQWVFLCVPNEADFQKIEAGAEDVKYLEHGAYCIHCTAIPISLRHFPIKRHRIPQVKAGLHPSVCGQWIFENPEMAPLYYGRPQSEMLGFPWLGW